VKLIKKTVLLKHPVKNCSKTTKLEQQAQQLDYTCMLLYLQAYREKKWQDFSTSEQYKAFHYHIKIPKEKCFFSNLKGGVFCL